LRVARDVGTMDGRVEYCGKSVANAALRYLTFQGDFLGSVYESTINSHLLSAVLSYYAIVLQTVNCLTLAIK
jgi:hypothetical protein